MNNPLETCEESPASRAWWAQVTLTPEEIKINVFRRGTSKGLKVEIPG